MKLLRGGIGAVALLLASCVFAQDKPAASKGYDLGACSPDGFVAVHVLVNDKDLSVDLVSPGPGVVEKQDKPAVYKFKSKDENGVHYVLTSEDGKHTLEIVLNFEKNIGAIVGDGKPVAALFVKADDDGAKLAENAMSEYKACLQLLQDVEDH